MTTRRSAFNTILRLLKSPLAEKLNILCGLFFRLKGVLYYRRVFGSFGSGSVLYKPLLLSCPQFMHIGSGVLIRPGARLEAVETSSQKPPELRIGKNVNIEQNVHIVCHSRIVIGNDVSITGHCAIVDVTHPYEDVSNPVKIGSRILSEQSSVEIGDGTFLGFGAVIMPNVRIGTHCVIGALSVVTRDMPDYSVAAGNPARILRRYDAASKEWISL